MSEIVAYLIAHWYENGAATGKMPARYE